MSYNGSGTFSLPAGNPVTTNTAISSSVHNTTLSEIATGLSTAITKDGQTTVTANLPMATYRHTGVGNPTARTQYATAAGCQDNTYAYLTSVAGTNTITATAALSMSAYATGQAFVFTPAGANTGATTLNLNSIGAKNVYVRGAACTGGEFVLGVPVLVVYDGTQWNAITYNQPGGWNLLATYTASASATIDFVAPDGLNDTYDQYMIVYTKIKPATDDVYFGLRIGTGGGPTYQTADYSYGGRMSGTGGGADVGSTSDDRIALSRTGAGQGVGFSTGEHIDGLVYFANPDDATDYFLVRFESSYIRSDGLICEYRGSGTYGSGAAISGVRFLFSSGNITSGSFRLYGLRK